jgi:hypothetical protein
VVNFGELGWSYTDLYAFIIAKGFNKCIVFHDARKGRHVLLAVESAQYCCLVVSSLILIC